MDFGSFFLTRRFLGGFSQKFNKENCPTKGPLNIKAHLGAHENAYPRGPQHLGSEAVTGDS